MEKQKKRQKLYTVQILCIGTDRSPANSADQDQTASEEDLYWDR